MIPAHEKLRATVPAISKMKKHKFDLNALAQAYNKSGHSVFGPSSSHMWLVCAGSLIPNMLADDAAGIDAAYGTVAHSCTEEWLKTGKKPKHLIGTRQFVYSGDWGFWIDIDHEMMDFVQMSVDRCILEAGHQVIEQRVDFSRLTPIPNQSGTMDFAAMKIGHAVVTDHKYGKGHKVYAKNNSQGMLYALGLFFEWDWLYDFQSFTIKINQPRLHHFDEWECSRDELIEFAGFVKARAALAWTENAPRTADPKACQFCKVRSTCTANIEMQFRMMESVTADAFHVQRDAEQLSDFRDSLVDDIEPFRPDVVDPLALTTAHLEALHPYKRMVESWWKAADHELLRRAINREALGTLKLVEGRAHRGWTSADAAKARLINAGLTSAQVAPPELVSPTEAEKLLKRAGYKNADLPDLLDGLIRKPPGKPTLAPLSDKRTAIVDLSALAFSDLTENSETDSTEE